MSECPTSPAESSGPFFFFTLQDVAALRFAKLPLEPARSEIGVKSGSEEIDMNVEDTEDDSLKLSLPALRPRSVNLLQYGHQMRPHGFKALVNITSTLL